MKIFILSLVFLTSVSFTGNATHLEIKKSISSDCVNCWRRANTLELMNYGTEGNFHYWETQYNACLDSGNSCSGQLDPVVVKGKKQE